MPLPIAREELRALIAAEMPDLIGIRHDLHMHPELGYEEVRTCGVVRRELGAAGVAFKDGLAGGTGVLGHIPGGGGGAIALCADMDALPILECTGLAWSSTVSGRMHACGHDGHTTTMIGVARVLAKIAARSPLPRPVTLVFQPAEEGGAGGRRMVEDGVLDGRVLGPPVERIFGLHGWPAWPLGAVGTRVGPMMAASDRFEIELRGVGGHAAWPHLTRDPVVATAAVVSAIQTIASRNIDPLDSVVVSLTMLNAGSGFNIIPDRSRICGTVRTLTPEVLAVARQRLEEVAIGVAAAYGCTATLTYRTGYPVTFNDAGAVEYFNETALEAVGSDRLCEVGAPVMGGEDFAFYGHKVPACFFVLGLIPPGHSQMPHLHQPDFDFTDDAMATGIEVFCSLALRDGG